MVLIPKVKGANRIEDFRSIALANFQFKVITKDFADRLASIAPKIISPNRGVSFAADIFTSAFVSPQKRLTSLTIKLLGATLPSSLTLKRLLTLLIGISFFRFCRPSVSTPPFIGGSQPY